MDDATDDVTTSPTRERKKHDGWEVYHINSGMGL